MEIKYFVRVKKLHMGKAARVSKVQGYYCTIHLCLLVLFCYALKPSYLRTEQSGLIQGETENPDCFQILSRKNY